MCDQVGAPARVLWQSKQSVLLAASSLGFVVVERVAFTLLRGTSGQNSCKGERNPGTCRNLELVGLHASSYTVGAKGISVEPTNTW